MLVFDGKNALGTWADAYVISEVDSNGTRRCRSAYPPKGGYCEQECTAHALDSRRAVLYV